MSKVRAKFVCSSVIDTEYNQVVVNMHAVYSDKGENKAFVEASPCGNFNMHIDKDAPASEMFKQGKSYYLDFSEAPEE